MSDRYEGLRERAQDFVNRHPPPVQDDEELDELLDAMEIAGRAKLRQIDARLDLEYRAVDMLHARGFKDLDAVSDEDIQTLAIEAETAGDLGGDVTPKWGSSAASIRKRLETVRAKRAVYAELEDDHDLSNDQIDALVRDTKRRIREHYAEDTEREIARTAAGKKVRKVDLAEMFIDDPDEAARIWDALYGDRA